MTKEEAIKRVKRYLTDCLPLYRYKEVEEIIKALKQEPCEDCVSRQAVNDVLRTMYDTHIVETDVGDEYIDYNDTVYEVEQLPTVEPVSKWIPVSERLPEEREWIGTKRFGTTISDEVYVTLETPDGERFTKHLSFQNGGLSQTDQKSMEVWFKGAVPIAWMPLPAPYELQESED